MGSIPRVELSRLDRRFPQKTPCGPGCMRKENSRMPAVLRRDDFFRWKPCQGCFGPGNEISAALQDRDPGKKRHKRRRKVPGTRARPVRKGIWISLQFGKYSTWDRHSRERHTFQTPIESGRSLIAVFTAWGANRPPTGSCAPKTGRMVHRTGSENR